MCSKCHLLTTSLNCSAKEIERLVTLLHLVVNDLVFLIDDYDEFPENLREAGLIVDILNRQILPLCGLVVSSCPHASVTLRQQASITVDILGFAEQEQQHYIQQTLKGEPEKIVTLT